MERKRFLKNDSGFVCENCSLVVEPLGYSSRNHCPRCLCSLHLDILPGDRSNNCGGLMIPIKTEPDPKRGYIITHKCTRCGKIRRNKSAHDAKIQPDNIDLLIALTAENSQ
ncbi:MAG: RNHCP domain-containing protein [Clostridiales bacterium]|nr:RNHCP domain-containing protein [Clostridiales bacterium]